MVAKIVTKIKKKRLKDFCFILFNDNFTFISPEMVVPHFGVGAIINHPWVRKTDILIKNIWELKGTDKIICSVVGISNSIR